MTYKFLAKNGPTIALLGAVVFILITVIPIFTGLSAFEALPENNQRAYSEEGRIFQVGIYVAAFLLIASVIIAVLLSLFQVISNPKGAIKGLIAFGVLVVLFLILYAMADPGINGPLAESIEKFQISESISKIISAGISTTLILAIGSVVLIVLLEVWNYFKNQ